MKTARILLVEDAEAIRGAVGAALRKRGFAVLGLSDGQELERQLAEPSSDPSTGTDGYPQADA